MSDLEKTIPKRQRDVLEYGDLVLGMFTAEGSDPALFGLTDADVAELGNLVAADRAALDEVNAHMLAARSKTKKLSGPKGTHRKLVAKLRAIARTARESKAPAGKLAAINIRRKNYHPASVTAPMDAPEFSIGGVWPGIINVRFRVTGSARPRARAAQTMGVQIAIVDATKPVADGEVDAAPSVFLSRNPGRLDSTKLPHRVRLYARWLTRRGKTGPWSLPLAVSVI
jgi:hypothetical protein